MARCDTRERSTARDENPTQVDVRCGGCGKSLLADLAEQTKATQMLPKRELIRVLGGGVYPGVPHGEARQCSECSAPPSPDAKAVEPNEATDTKSTTYTLSAPSVADHGEKRNI